ncbi:MAG: T9SS type A sorting domain-containing protein [Ignavibacteriae bacterium]|nr:T9SS type A sorting domain-containing protein [Ignavibacteriota bacterium]
MMRRLVLLLIFMFPFIYQNGYGEVNEKMISYNANELFQIKTSEGKKYLNLKNNFTEFMNSEGCLLIKDFPLNSENYINLELKRKNSIIDKNTKFLTNTFNGEVSLKSPKVYFFSGLVNGNKHEKAYLIQIDNFVFGAIFNNDIIQYCIAPEHDSNPNESGIVNVKDFKSTSDFIGCLNDKIENLPQSNKFRGIEKPLTNDLLELELAVETDTEFFKATGSNPALAQAYAIAIFTMVNAIYEDELNISIKLSWLKNWTDSPADPYDVKGNAYALPDKVRQYWKSNYSNVQRDLFHVMTSISYGGGGYGYFDALCDNKEYGFSVSSVQASHSFPILAFNYDVYIVAHELGHNFNGHHTHSCYFGAPIDTCITNDAIQEGCLDASVTPKPNPGSIMSYCGGTNNQFGLGYQVKMDFDPQNAVLMRSTAENATCLTTPKKPSIAIIYPFGNQRFKYGDSLQIKWNSSSVNSIGIDFSIDNGFNWYHIKDSIAASEKLFAWHAPGICSNNIKLRIYSMEDSTVADTSLIPFSIYLNDNDDLLAFYPFTGNTKNVVCGGFPDGIPAKIPQLVDDRFGNQQSACRFSDGNYIWIPDADLNHKEITIAFWFNGDSWSGKQFFLGTNTGPALNIFEIYYWGDLGCSYYLNQGLYQCWSSAWPSANKWNHAVFTYNGDTAKIYINSYLTKVEFKSGELLNFTTTLYIGSRKSNEPFTGAIDDIYIFKKALTESEIVNLYYENPVPPIKPNLLFPIEGLMIDSSNVSFLWEKIPYAGYYHLQVSNHFDMDNNSLMLNDSLISDTTYNLSELHNGFQYYWRVSASNYFGKSDWSDVYSFIYDSLSFVESQKSDFIVEIKPIPANEKLNLNIKNAQPGDYEISCLDEFGRILSTEHYVNNDSELFIKNVDISKLTTGIYFLNIRLNTLSVRKKFIILK